MELKDKPLRELRQLARTRGIKGYSKLTKPALIALLSKEPFSARTPDKGEETAKTRPATATERRAHPRPQPSAPLTEDAGREQLVEDVKFALTPPGRTVVVRQPMVDLGEDIENLPAPAESFICLLPQKPGILHAYWQLLAGTTRAEPELRLRLCAFKDDAPSIIEELRVLSDSGHWYFHLHDAPAGQVFLQLGTYRNGEFISSIRRGIARIPSLHAASREDREWWVSPEQFRAMYRRAGGVSILGVLGWKPDHSFSSR